MDGIRMKQLVILALFSVAFSQPEQILTGYLMQSEMSFCMDECGEYYIETFGDMYWPVVFNSNIDNIDLYIDRYVEVWIDQEITCVECNAYEVTSIALSDDCLNPVNCFVDPCEVASECQINTPIECVTNYCDGCYADFYDLDGNLVDCNNPLEECEAPNPAGCFQTGCLEGFECIDDWDNNCVPSVCSCDEDFGEWFCTNDCNGGTCYPLGYIIFGDINNDSLVNVLDIVLIVSFILMTYEPTDVEFSTGDVNSDGQLNVLDVVAIVQMILNPVELPEDCYIEPEIGPCLGLCPTYYFNQETNECEEFITGCCGVEAFNTMGACQNACE